MKMKCLFQCIDERLVTLQEVVCAGARSEREICRHLKVFVERELYQGKQAPKKRTDAFTPLEEQ